MTGLPPFSGDNPRCRKCGYRGAHTTWVPNQHEQSVIDYPHHKRVTSPAVPEHLARACIRCAYHWREDIVRTTN